MLLDAAAIVTIPYLQYHTMKIVHDTVLAGVAVANTIRHCDLAWDSFCRQAVAGAIRRVELELEQFVL